MTTTATANRPFYAVRVLLTHADGSTSERDYVRGAMPVARDIFGQFALGNMVALCAGDVPTAWEVTAIEADEVR